MAAKRLERREHNERIKARDRAEEARYAEERQNDLVELRYQQ